MLHIIIKIILVFSIRSYIHSHVLFFFFNPGNCYIISCSLLNASSFIQTVDIICCLASHRRNCAAHLVVCLFPYTGEELWAQLWRLPVGSMSGSIFLCRWHQQGQLPASCYRFCSLGDCSQEHHSRPHTQSADANTQPGTSSWSIHRYRSHWAGIYRQADAVIYYMICYTFATPHFRGESCALYFHFIFESVVPTLFSMWLLMKSIVYLWPFVPF